MAQQSGFQEHWLNIEPERMERYEEMHNWNPVTERQRPHEVTQIVGQGMKLQSDLVVVELAA